MTRKQAGIISTIAFVVLIRPCANLFSFLDMMWGNISGDIVTPYIRLLSFMFEKHGAVVANLATVAIAWILPAILAITIYCYLRRRDFSQVCEDCAAHKVRSWFAFALFMLFSFTSLSKIFYTVESPQDEAAFDEASDGEAPISLEICLCHHDSPEIGETRQIDGYTAMRKKGDETEVHYVFEEAELTEADVESATVSKSPVNGLYDIQVKLTDEGAAAMLDLTRNYMPLGRKNPTEKGRNLAIIINGELIVAPSIMCEIGRYFCIAGKFSESEARAIATMLNHAARSRQKDVRDV